MFNVGIRVRNCVRARASVTFRDSVMLGLALYTWFNAKVRVRVRCMLRVWDSAKFWDVNSVWIRVSG